MSASFQKCVGAILTLKLNKVIKELYRNNTKDLSVSVVGGVANNDYLKKCFNNIEERKTIIEIMLKALACFMKAMSFLNLKNSIYLTDR